MYYPTYKGKEMTWLHYVLDWFQIIFASYILFNTYWLIAQMTREYNALRPFEKQILTKREEANYSPKMFLIGRSFVNLLFIVLQLEWTLDKSSAVLTSGRDTAWFILGVLVCLVWLKGNHAQKSVWKYQTKFRETSPPCGNDDCPPFPWKIIKAEEGLRPDNEGMKRKAKTDTIK